jgi:probable rRNA maturation factor
MLRVDLDGEPEWGELDNWQKIADVAVEAAFSVSPFADLIDNEKHYSISAQLSVDENVHSLNLDYRGKDKATNVLSFPMMSVDEIAASSSLDMSENMLGDLILAYETCAKEAAEKAISVEQHATHLIVHGTLHLLGFDHLDENEATDMEAREVKALASMGIANPYSD